MGFGDFLKKAGMYTASATALITAAPVLGAAGAITAAGTGVATALGTIAAASEEL